MYYDHIIKETPNDLSITSTITMNGILRLLWVQLFFRKIANTMASYVQKQIKVATKLF